MILKTLPIVCYFDPISDICIGATLPDAEQLWLAGSSQCQSVVTGMYLLPIVVHVACNSCETFYEFYDCPLGKTAQQLWPYTQRGDS